MLMSLPWEKPGWRNGATEWIDQHVIRTAEIELVRARPWSAIARVPTSLGDAWFKENNPVNAFEPALTELLSRRRPDCLPEVIACEGARMITLHVGPQLREVFDSGESDPSWGDVLPLYAEAQIDFADLVPDALAVGTPDERPELLPGLYDELEWPDDLQDPVRRAAEALAGTLPPTVAHQEAHDGNVFVRDGRAYFLDWAEATVTHPFIGPLLALRSAIERAGYEPGSPAAERVRDLYLEPFTRFAPMAELRAAFANAYLLAPIGRALVWHRTLASLPEPMRQEYGDPVAAWLEILRGISSGAITLGGA
jgi:hypothetical protein